MNNARCIDFFQNSWHSLGIPVSFFYWSKHLFSYDLLRNRCTSSLRSSNFPYKMNLNLRNQKKSQLAWSSEYGDCLFFGVLRHINLCRLCNVKSILFQTIQFTIRRQFNCQKHFYFNLFSLVKHSNSNNTVNYMYIFVKNSSISNTSV